MTAPAVDLQATCEAIWEATLAEDRRVEAMQQTPPGIFVFDGHQRLQHLLLDVVAVHGEDMENETGSIELTLPFDHPVAQWMNDRRGARQRGEGKNFHIDVEHNGVRLSGRYESKRVTKDWLGQRLLVVSFLTDYENLKWVDCWSNPFLPAIFQFPRIFLLAGPAIWCLKTALFLNLLRIYSSIWQIPDDPLNPMTWLDGLDMSTWDIVIKPTTLLQDLAAGTTWCMFMSRWGKWHDNAAPIMADAELSVVTRRYRAGDPEPWPGADIKDGALVVDIVDKSAHREGAFNGGTIFDGLTRTIRESVGSMVEDIEVELTGSPSWPSEFYDTMFTTPPGFPFAHFPADYPTETEFTESPEKGIIINTGGQSAPGVNEAISAGIQALGDLVTSNINIAGYGIGPQGGAIDAILKPFYTDTVLAWISVKLPQRIARGGSSHYLEYHIDLPGKAYTLSSLMAIRTGVKATEEKRHGKVTTVGGPYVVGWPGSGHFYKGDRGSFEIAGDLTGEIHVERCTKTTFDWAADDFAKWEAEFGPDPERDPIESLIKTINQIATAASQLGVW